MFRNRVKSRIFPDKILKKGERASMQARAGWPDEGLKNTAESDLRRAFLGVKQMNQSRRPNRIPVNMLSTPATLNVFFSA